MAEPKKRGTVWRVQIRVAGYPSESGTFDRRADAIAWRDKRTAELKKQKDGGIQDNKTLNQAIDRYLVTDAKNLKSIRTITLILRATARMIGGDRALSNFTSADFARYKEMRIKSVAPATVNKEMTTLSSVFNVAIREWRWCEINPLTNVRKFPATPHRKTVFTQEQITKILNALGFEPDSPPQTMSQQVAVVFLIALETGMRAGEIVNLNWDDVDFAGQRFILHDTKNGSARDVPMLGKSEAFIRLMTGLLIPRVFLVEDGVRDTLFRRALKKAGIEGMRFHDSRHTAATRLAPKIDVATLCKIFGWRDPKFALVYYNPTAKQIKAAVESGK